jgi:hypothetical protein
VVSEEAPEIKNINLFIANFAPPEQTDATALILPTFVPVPFRLHPLNSLV